MTGRTDERSAVQQGATSRAITAVVSMFTTCFTAE